MEARERKRERMHRYKHIQHGHSRKRLIRAYCRGDRHTCSMYRLVEGYAGPQPPPAVCGVQPMSRLTQNQSSLYWLSSWPFWLLILYLSLSSSIVSAVKRPAYVYARIYFLQIFRVPSRKISDVQRGDRMKEHYVLCFVAESCTILCDAIAFAVIISTSEIRSGRESIGKLERV